MATRREPARHEGVDTDSPFLLLPAPQAAPVVSDAKSTAVLPEQASAPDASPPAVMRKATMAKEMPARKPISTFIRTSAPAPTAVPASAPLPVIMPAAAPIEVASRSTHADSNNAAALRDLRNAKIDAAEAALGHGDEAAAMDILTPLAEAGAPRAQVLLGRIEEGSKGRKKNDFAAFVWYSIAARSGEPRAQVLRDTVAGRLQPAEIRQAEKVVDSWKPRADLAGSTTN
jgi:TPR repeat protein